MLRSCFMFLSSCKFLSTNDMYLFFFQGFMNILLAFVCLSNAAPCVQTIVNAVGAAGAVFKIIDQKPIIDSASDAGLKLSSISGHIRFRNVHFHYPSRPETKILQGINVEATPGQTIALVGASGCGKSTLVQLLLRFYDPQQGQILIDNKEIRSLNVTWLRQHIGVVSQEPVLFNRTIAENIRYGRDGVSMEEIELACKKANAYDFIMKLPNTYETLVGQRGTQLSGGQKQRIAIARALVRDPKILLLDEATSALDNASESIVQDALDKARKGRTTIVIAHRLSTIRTADIIVGIHEGKDVEKGTHAQLMESKGIYYQLYTNQTSAEIDKDILSSDDEHHTTSRRLNEHDSKRTSRVKDTSSRGDVKIDEEEEEEDDDGPANAPVSRLLKMNMKEWPFLLLGCIASFVIGCSQPAFAIIFGEASMIYSEPIDDQEHESKKYSLAFVLVGCTSLVSYFIQGYAMAVSGEALTRRIRSKMFRTMLRQDMTWFDHPKNNTGALTSRLAIDAARIQGVTGTQMGFLLMAVSSLSIGVVAAILYSWRLTLATLLILPALMGAGFVNMKRVAGASLEIKEALLDAGKAAVEATENVRTVVALSRESTFIDIVSDKLSVVKESSVNGAFNVGFMMGVSQAANFMFPAVIFGYGAYLVEEGVIDTDDIMMVFSILFFCGTLLGSASALMPDMGKAKAAAKRVISLLDQVPEIDSLSSSREHQDSETLRGSINFTNVSFSYALRSEVEVFKSLSLTVEAGQTVALVGSSGCGKSTVISLLERFYNPKGGSIVLDRHSIQDVNKHWLRSQMGLVSQEPVLFDCSIAENIAYGDNTRTVTSDEIIKVARMANIHEFITALPQGYETKVGEKGTQLSGGQKQRIAIARALVRNPKILLLDEATSALDTESEKIVQEALINAREGRTCITIAHRLSTIQDADIIFVIDKGVVVEKGNHEELMSCKGLYYKLHKASCN
ncbi:ATP-dependent translocase ABCB1 [Aplysia californica]|uniref:ATP-dependent translocase ABCB1 n=1 Tax=Aplysia californica TaxID=6500 RepID=A0ABM1AFV0_APLCA|nr:ATP-dependent translocase ABCB1 [Aplysia californica]